ncbi:hypothetical protein EMIHUDRAFT_260531 [Emiliania huxleyi CCMP1516]|uniref:Uncharacterized protein n=2 Tax=Emiliania huxleyi TaxID=2903 RepID=A0A0D3KTM6_EMIH1|nr:hypothetical protein EMIHUDRAFT_260531 [Emiliania huxleyi CCMP1516]EOD39111.1 hypothetical protein EMIHUDRAFT_260531 [Emiliania huxleyi CCMP1516]|eukprot:XP_005791540.1 hypothetical protein EMIHUDRAFT_260531 [Emiliania huxleyi CCMP1516]
MPILPNSPDLADALETAVVAAASMAEPVTRASRRLESARIVHAARGVVTTGRPDESASPHALACTSFSGKQKGKQRVPSTLRFRKFPGKTEGVWCSILETREFP